MGTPAKRSRGYKTKADKAFEEKVQFYIKLNDWIKVEEVTLQYEAYQKLVEPIQNTAPTDQMEPCVLNA